MSLAISIQLLAWSVLINYALLVFWFLILVLAPGWLYSLHSRWFKISEQAFYLIHYAGMGLFKLLIFVFLLVPYLVLRFII